MDICKEIKRLQSNLQFYKNRVEKLEEQIKAVTNISNIHNPDEFDEILKSNYSREEISIAYHRMLEYEGVKDRKGGLIIDTFIEFLNGTHHSLNGA